MKTKNKSNEKIKRRNGRKILLIILIILAIAIGFFAYRVQKNGGGIGGVIATTLGQTSKNVLPITWKKPKLNRYTNFGII